MPLNDLRKAFKLTTIGTYAPQLGLHLMKHGFAVEIVTNNPRLVKKEDAQLSQRALLSSFRRIYQGLTDDNDRMVLGHFLRFMEKGGLITVKIPDIDDISQEVSAGRPLVAVLNNASLYTREEGRPFSETFHIVVISGFDKDHVILSDPYSGKEGGKRAYPSIQFLFALYSSSLTDYDNGSLMKIKRQVV